MLLSKKVQVTQPNPRYSPKNNDAIRMIASFMPHITAYLNMQTKNLTFFWGVASHITQF